MGLSRTQLLELVWHDAGAASPNRVKLYVGYLRRKLDPEHPDRVPIETMRGRGWDTRNIVRLEMSSGARTI